MSSPQHVDSTVTDKQTAVSGQTPWLPVEGAIYPFLLKRQREEETGTMCVYCALNNVLQTSVYLLS